MIHDNTMIHECIMIPELFIYDSCIIYLPKFKKDSYLLVGLKSNLSNSPTVKSV